MSSDSTIIITLTKGQQTVIDAIDADLSGLKWYAFDNGKGAYYAARDASRKNNAPKKTIFLHQIILSRILGRDISDKCVPDHVDRNTLNNVRGNLREATVSQNGTNAKIRTDNTSGTKGVSWQKRERKWQAFIYIEKRKRSLGYFDMLDDAISARKEAEIAHYGDFSHSP